MLVNIAICTYHRPNLLADSLDSLLAMNIPDGVSIQVLVVDNDVAESARPVVEERDGGSIRLHYMCEPRRGIPVARNAAIYHALKCNADCLAFIDDDETVDANWLVALLSHYQREGGRSVVSGSVVPVIPSNVNKAVQQFFVRSARKTGERLKHCATNNVLIPAYVYTEMGMRFDETLELAGGEDTLFFSEAVSRGVDVVVCAEALVYEKIPDNRLSLRWQAKRKFLAGITLSVVDLRRKKSRLLQLGGAFFKMIFLVGLSICLFLVGKRERSCREFLKFFRTLGKFCGLVGYRATQTYQYIDNSDMS